jgi:UDP-N-acetylmuramyl tripeptide synthase
VNDFPNIANGAYPLMGLYNVYNTHAALVATAVAIDVDQNEALSILKTDFRPMFGRQEMVRYMGRSLTILLSKNPAGFNQSIDAISQLARHKKVAVLLCLNDHIPDGRDVSWIWDVDFEAISEKTVSHIACCGDRAYDMALRIAYTKDASPSVSRTGTYMLGEHPVHLSIARGVDAYTQMAPQDAELFVLATYSAMLEVRKHVVGHNFAAQP